MSGCPSACCQSSLAVRCFSLACACGGGGFRAFLRKRSAWQETSHQTSQSLSKSASAKAQVHSTRPEAFPKVRLRFHLPQGKLAPNLCLGAVVPPTVLRAYLESRRGNKIFNMVLLRSASAATPSATSLRRRRMMGKPRSEWRGPRHQI